MRLNRAFAMSRRVLWLLFLGLFLQGSAVAQGLPTTLEFSFSNPGARSMGFGGAFVALADDATAAFANPAGLVQLTRPEISLEGRSWSYLLQPVYRGGKAHGSAYRYPARQHAGTSNSTLLQRCVEPFLPLGRLSQGTVGSGNLSAPAGELRAIHRNTRAVRGWRWISG
jgi:long-subunit fatty acid transport protein